MTETSQTQLEATPRGLRGDVNMLGLYLNAYNFSSYLPKGEKNIKAKITQTLLRIQAKNMYIKVGEGYYDASTFGQSDVDFEPGALQQNYGLINTNAAPLIQRAINVIADDEQVWNLIPLIGSISADEDLSNWAQIIIEKQEERAFTERNVKKIRWFCNDDGVVEELLKSAHAYQSVIASAPSLIALGSQINFFKDKEWVGVKIKQEIFSTSGEVVEVLNVVEEDILQKVDRFVNEAVFNIAYGQGNYYLVTNPFSAANYLEWRRQSKDSEELSQEEKIFLRKVLESIDRYPFFKQLDNSSQAELKARLETTNLVGALLLRHFIGLDSADKIQKVIQSLRMNEEDYISFLDQMIGPDILFDMANKSEKYRFHLAVLLMNKGYHELDERLINLLGISPSEASINVKLGSKWNICSEADQRMRNAFLEGVIIEEPTSKMLIKLVGKIIAVPRESYATDKHTILAGMYYPVEGQLRKAAITAAKTRNTIVSANTSEFVMGKAAAPNVTNTATDFLPRKKLPRSYYYHQESEQVKLAEKIEYTRD